MNDPHYRHMIEFLRELGTDEVPHSGKPFLAHLISVYRDLERWGCELEVCRAGMFHSIYGTETFQRFSLPLERRGNVQSLIGERAERLAFFNSMMDRPRWDAIFLERREERKVVDRITGEEYPLSPQDFEDLATVHVCDWLEQVPRSRQWDYRRDAYRAMAAWLGGVAQQEYARVFAGEADAANA